MREVVHGAEGEALWIEVRIAGQIGPELIFVVGPEPDIPVGAVLKTAAGRVNGARVVSIGVRSAALGQTFSEVDAAKALQALGIGLEVAEVAQW